MSRPLDLPDRIELRGLRGRGHHGWFDFETEQGQDFVVDLVLHTDHTAAAASDHLDDTVDYGSLAQAVVAVIEGEPVKLIETLADRIATLCLLDDRVGAVHVSVHKPQAPVIVAFDDVIVSVSRSRSALRAVVALGSNLGDRLSHLQSAVDALDAEPGVYVELVGPVVQTAPVGGPEQPDYLNSVAVLNTVLGPSALLSACHRAESARGRERTQHWGPRTLDVDLLMLGELTSPGPAVELPHPRAHERAFVLVPWAQLAPDDEIPGRGRVSKLLAALPESERAQVLGFDGGQLLTPLSGRHDSGRALGPNPSPDPSPNPGPDQGPNLGPDQGSR